MSGAQSVSVAGVKIVVVTDEQAFADSVRAAFAASAQVDLEIVREKLSTAQAIEFEGAVVLIADLGDER